MGNLPPMAALTLLYALSGITFSLRLYSKNLVRLYPASFCFGLFNALASCAFVFTSSQPNFYGRLFLVIFPLEWLIYALVVRELYSGIFHFYQGFVLYGRWTLYGAGLLAVVAAVIRTRTLNTRYPMRDSIFAGFESAGQILVFGFALMLIVLLLVISRFPMHLHRNLMVCSLCVSTFMFSEACILIAERLMFFHNTAANNGIGNVIGILCFVCWSLLISPETRASRKDGPSEHAIDAHEAILLSQLALTNAFLLKLAGKSNEINVNPS